MSIKKLTDKRLSELLKIPSRTITDWKKSKTYKKDLYKFLKSISESEILEFIEKSKGMVRSSDELTNEEINKNIDLINFALGGGVHFARKDVLEDMKACEADTNDIGSE